MEPLAKTLYLLKYALLKTWEEKKYPKKAKVDDFICYIVKVSKLYHYVKDWQIFDFKMNF